MGQNNPPDHRHSCSMAELSKAIAGEPMSIRDFKSICTPVQSELPYYVLIVRFRKFAGQVSEVHARGPTFSFEDH
jgi:hypothetical protein